MRKTIKKIFIATCLGVLFAYTTVSFLHYKIKQELTTYLALNEEVKKLQDIYALCNGLLNTNPIQENIVSCNSIIVKINNISYKMKQECPYIDFYTSYIKSTN